MSETVKLSSGEKLILLMLCEIYEHLKIKGQTDTELIKEAIFSGNLWGLGSGMPGVFHDSETPLEVVHETVNILVMWERLEQSFKNLGPEDKATLAKSSEAFGENVKFPGFDGNNESEYISATRFLVESLDRFQHFKGRDFNAHMPTLDGHRRMLKVFDPILKRVLNKDFSAAQIKEVLAAWRE
jgi:uncharacterized protein YfbU (UPF0304 family)